MTQSAWHITALLCPLLRLFPVFLNQFPFDSQNKLYYKRLTANNSRTFMNPSEHAHPEHLELQLLISEKLLKGLKFLFKAKSSTFMRQH